MQGRDKVSLIRSAGKQECQKMVVVGAGWGGVWGFIKSVICYSKDRGLINEYIKTAAP